MEREPVYLWNVTGYDPERIAELVGQSMDEMGLTPRGRVLVKPNCVIAHKPMFQNAFTRAEVLDGVLAAVRARSEAVDELVVGERCGITIPTRFAFANAGYNPVRRKHGVPVHYFDEESQVEVPLVHAERLRDAFYLPETVASTDFLINVPKFKAHPWTTVTLGLKNFIGIQDDAHRLIDHDHRLDQKIVDLNFAVRQSLVVIDGVIAGAGRMLTPRPVELGILVVAKNPVATDAIGCRIAGIEPEGVHHVRLAAEQGLGPAALEDIELRGDVSLEEACARAEKVGLRHGLVRVEQFFQGTNIRSFAGPPPEPERTDYCWGGCPGASEEAMDILREMDPKAGEKIKPMLLLYGDLRGRDIERRPGEKIVAFGDCVRFDGKVDGQQVTLESTYVDRAKKCIHSAKAEGFLATMFSVLLTLFRSRKAPIIRRHGCPASVSAHVLTVATLGKVKNPYLDRRVVVPFAWHWTVNVLVIGFKRLFGRLKNKRVPHPAGRYPAVEHIEDRAAEARARLGAA